MSQKLASCFRRVRNSSWPLPSRQVRNTPPPRPGGREPSAPPPSLLSSWPPGTLGPDGFFLTRLLREASDVNSVLHGPRLGGSAHHSEGRDRCQFPTETFVAFHLRKLCWQRIVQEDFVITKKKLKSAPQKNGPILWGYNQSSMPFKRREPKSSFLNSWPFLPKPEGYVSPQQRCNAA